MYEIKPQPVKSFIEDSTIKLPRFQRKKTWSPEKNFLLAVSIFKGYPLGVTILNIEKDKNGNVTKWLLDGRQRMNALKEMYHDPEKIYLWARKYVKFKNNDQPDDVINKFTEKVNEYIELEENSVEEDSVEISEDEESEEIEGTKIENETLRNSGLQLLASLISLTHNVGSKCTGLSKPFDFSKYLNNVYYIEEDGKLNSRKIKSTMKQYRDYCTDGDLDYMKKENFIKFIETRTTYKSDDKKASFRSQLEISWKNILERIILFDNVDKLFSSASIGLIEVSDITVTDSQKIFNIINDGGTKLTAAEILSAKPSWNIKVPNPSQTLIDATQELYKKIEVTNDGIVRWDLSATLVGRLKNKDFIVGEFKDDPTGFEKEVGLGFKILSGIYQNGVKKEDISRLSTNSKINWCVDIDEEINDLNNLFKLISDCSFFKYLKSWKTSVRTLLSDAVMLDFVLLLRRDWINKGKPMSDNNATRVQKNAFILFDRLVYEYTTRQWRGSSDSKLAKNLVNFTTLQSEDGIFIPVTEERWNNLIVNILDNNSIEDAPIDQQSLTPILYYYYCLKEQVGPSGIEDIAIEVDHIIPQTKFDNSTINNKEIIKHNLFNLGLLPKKDNVSKSNKSLREITDSWLQNQIITYEEISKDEFEKYSDVNNYKDLKNKRGELFKQVFTANRRKLLNN